MSDQRDQTRSMLGELSGMSSQTDAMSRQILASAQKRLAGIQSSLNEARVKALTGDDDAKRSYEEMIEERGRLQHVIARASADG